MTIKWDKGMTRKKFRMPSLDDKEKKKKNHNLLFEAEDIYAHLKGTATKLIRPSPSYLQDLPNILFQITARLKSVCNAGIRYEGKKNPPRLLEKKFLPTTCLG